MSRVERHRSEDREDLLQEVLPHVFALFGRKIGVINDEDSGFIEPRHQFVDQNFLSLGAKAIYFTFDCIQLFQRGHSIGTGGLAACFELALQTGHPSPMKNSSMLEPQDGIRKL